VDFYGDFRVGGPFTVIGGFNADLGWSTTNNAFDDDEVYALDAAPGRPDHVLFDGAALPLTRETVTLRFRDGEGLRSEVREVWTSPLGPVVAQDGGKVYIVRTAGDGEFRNGEQFLRMMQATSLSAWRDAMRMHARGTSNFTYADRAGSTFFVWNAFLPRRPHPAGRDSVVVPARETRDIWTRILPWDSLPQVLNPAGGYLQNANDPPHFTTLAAPLDSAALPVGVPGPALSLRSQLSLDLLRGDDLLSLEEVVARKHSYRMLLAERIKDDLLAAVAASGDTTATVRDAAAVLVRWDNTAAPDSRGGVLFEEWWRRYAGNGAAGKPAPWALPWDLAAPTTTPDGLRDPAEAVRALGLAAAQVRRKYGALDVAWGQVHRIRIGGRDIPVGGCSGSLGCFRVLQFREEADGTRRVTGGDGWILAVEFGESPRAVSVLGYGNSSLEGSPFLGDQAERFARGELKPVLFKAADVDAAAERRYRPD
jgi:acyl-homoserine-lactone acylase